MWRYALFAALLLGSPVSALCTVVDLPLVHSVQNYLDLNNVPEQRLQEILSIDLEFSDGGAQRRTTLGHWISETINFLEYGRGLREGLDTGEFFRRREQYFNALLDDKLDPVRFRRERLRNNAADIFAYWGDQLAGAKVFGPLKISTDLIRRSLDALEIYAAFGQLFEQQRDKWMLTYFDARKTGDSSDRAWEFVQPMITFRIDQEKLREFLETSYEAYVLAVNPAEAKLAMRAIVEALMPSNKNAARVLSGTWVGFWQQDERNCPQEPDATKGPFAPVPITPFMV
jgi:hypothetical protein